MTTSRARFLAVTTVGAAVVLGGCACPPKFPTDQFFGCEDVMAESNAPAGSDSELSHGRCYIFRALPHQNTYMVRTKFEGQASVRAIARGCGGGGGGGGGGGEVGNGGGGGGGSNYEGMGVSLPTGNLKITVGNGGQGGNYRSVEPKCANVGDLSGNQGCAGENGSSTTIALVSDSSILLELKGGQGGSGGLHNSANTNPPSNGGGGAQWGGNGGKGGAGTDQPIGRDLGKAIAGAPGGESIGLFRSQPGAGESFVRLNSGRVRIIAGGGGGGGGFHFSSNPSEAGKGGDGAHPAHSATGVTGKDAEDGMLCAGGGGGAGWEGTALHSRGGKGGPGILILDLR